MISQAPVEQLPKPILTKEEYDKLFRRVSITMNEKIAQQNKFHGDQKAVRTWLARLEMKWHGNHERFASSHYS